MLQTVNASSTTRMKAGTAKLTNHNPETKKAMMLGKIMMASRCTGRTTNRARQRSLRPRAIMCGLTRRLGGGDVSGMVG
jgi:hypothetical protein